MKQTCLHVFGVAIALLFGVFDAQAGILAKDLRCAYQEDPLGIDNRSPRLSWKLASPERGQRQTAYRVLVSSSPEQLQRGEGDLWDSGRVDSEQSTHICYGGKPPVARQRCFWKVQSWDQDGEAGGWSSVAVWEMGLPDAADWADADWIRLARDTRNSPLTKRTVLTRHMTKPRTVEAFPSALFRREFELQPGVVRARAYVSGLGYSELYVNGQRVGNAVLDPGQTTYDVRAFYVTHDITKLLRPGPNAAGIMLGSGFFGQNHAFNTQALMHGEPAVIAKLVVDYADGSTQVLATDPSWKAATGPILYDNVYGGESYDARLEQPGWNRPGYDDTPWQAAMRVEPVTKRLLAQMIPPMREIETINPQRVFPGEGGRWIFDLGRNIAGWPRLKVQAPAGAQLTLRCAEILMPDGKTLDHATTGVFATGVEQMEIYVCKGGGVETWQPRFTYHGFRYVEVEGLPGEPAKDLLAGVLVHTDVPRIGSFECSDEILNRIYRTSLWTIEDNMHSTMEDCPHREKCGWLGDAHAVGETAIFNYDMAQFWTKFVDDIETVLGRGGVTYWGQKATSGIPCNIAVGRRLCQEARPDWGSAYVLLPWYLYTYCGDTALFARHYEHLKRWMDYVQGLCEDGIVVRGYGDWCPPGGNANMECPVPLTSTAYFYATLRIMETFANQLEKPDEAAAYAGMAEETRSAFNRAFFDESAGGYGSQTADAVALRFGIHPEGQAARVANALAHEVTEKHQGHAFVGIHGGRPLYTQLCEHGYEDIAIAALKQETWPGHAYLLEQGCTTWPEVADEVQPLGRTSGRSLNHPMQSGFAAWFHESLGGIRPGAPGFKRIDLNPHGFTRLAWVKATHDGPYGEIQSSWRSEAGRFHWTVSVPVNSAARAWVPAVALETVEESGRPAGESPGVTFVRFDNGRAMYELASGTYRFTSRL